MADPKSLASRVGRAFTGPAWHGAPLSELLADVTFTEAAAHPFDDVHSIAELVGHIGAWTGVAERRLGGDAVVPDETDQWPDIDAANANAWASAIAACLAAHESLMRAVAAVDERHLATAVPGHDYDAATMVRGIVEHDAYHGGQIAMLKKVIRAKHRDSA
ncbi:MAG: DinB family protein [Gemmatimonadota bacterium]|nr:DinB family protein [Gemmatimonadota bacterium]